MPSKSLLSKLDEVIEDTKIINDFYLENGPDGINEMIPPVKYLLATIVDVLNDGIEGPSRGFFADKQANFYLHFKNISSSTTVIAKSDSHDDFDKGIIWIIERLNSKQLAKWIVTNFDELKTFYRGNSLMLRQTQKIIDYFTTIDELFTFKLHPEDLYVTRSRIGKRADSVTETDELKLESEGVYENPNSDVMNSSFISMEAIDVKLLQERELRNDFGLLNRVKYNSLRLFHNFKHYNLKSSRSSINIQVDADDFESVSMTACGNEKELAALLSMEICPERGLLAQNFACTECSNGISMKESIKCDFNGDYLCPKCHGGSKCINPVRIMRNWDFNRYPICTKCKRLIAQISYNELFNFSEINKKMIKNDERFVRIMQLREKIFRAVQKRLHSAVGKKNQQKQIAIMERLAWPKVHLITSTNMFTIEDLIEIEGETFYTSVLVPLYNLLKL